MDRKINAQEDQWAVRLIDSQINRMPYRIYNTIYHRICYRVYYKTHYGVYFRFYDAFGHRI